MTEIVELGADNSIQVQCRDERATIAFGPQPYGVLLTGDRHELHDLVKEAYRQLSLLNGGMFARRRT